MTIAISMKVNDGIVLAADSASTIMAQTPQGVGVINIYDKANKVFNLRNGPYLKRKKEEVGITWNGEPEAITRLYLGFGTALPQVLKKFWYR